MGVGSSMGAYYDDEFHQAAAQWDDKYDDNVITPNQAQTNKQLDQVEQTELGGTPIAYKTASPLVTITDEDIDKGINVAMSAGPGTIAGVRSMTADAYALFKGAPMRNRGAAEEEVQAATGWWKGKSDGKNRYEISDDALKLTDRDWHFGETGKLSDFVEHPELFKAYPELKDINFKVADKDFKSLGSFNYQTNTLTINPSRIRAGDEGLLDVITHELQHAVQNREGFSSGSSPERALKDAVLSTAKIKDEKEAWSILGSISKNARDFADYMYQRVPGEVEANNTMARRKLTPEQRKEFPPQFTQKMLEGEPNSMSGGTYLPEFNYP